MAAAKLAYMRLESSRTRATAHHDPFVHREPNRSQFIRSAALRLSARQGKATTGRIVGIAALGLRRSWVHRRPEHQRHKIASTSIFIRTSIRLVSRSFCARPSGSASSRRRHCVSQTCANVGRPRYARNFPNCSPGLRFSADTRHASQKPIERYR